MPNIGEEIDINEVHPIGDIVDISSVRSETEKPKKSFFSNMRNSDGTEQIPASMKAAMRVLSIPGAVTKAATLGTLAQLKDLYTGNDETKYIKEGLMALTGEGVPAAEYYKRLGAPEGTATNVAGGITDFGADLVGGYATSKGAERLGAAMRRVPYSKMDAVLKQNNRMPISDILKESGKDKSLTQSGIVNNIEDLLSKTTAEKQALENPLLSSTATAPIDDVLSKAKAHIENLKNSGSAIDRRIGERLEKEITDQMAIGSDVTYKQIQDIKKAAGSKVGDFFNRLPPQEDKFYKAMGGGARETGQNLASKISPETAAQIAEKNTRISSMLTSLPQAERKALTEAGKNKITEIDAILAAAEPTAFMGKMGGKILKAPGPWTYGGAALENLGKFGKKATIPASIWLEYNRLKEGDN